MKQRHKNHSKKQNQARISRGISIGLAAITVVAGASLVVPHISQSFTDTSQTPPQSNVEAPIDVGPDDQWKEGNLGISTNSAPGAALDVGGNVNIESGNILSTDDIFVRNATPVNGSQLLTDLLGQGGGGTGSLSAVLSQGNKSGGSDIQMTGNSTITGVPAPTNGSDVATKNYVDAQAGGGSGGSSYSLGVFDPDESSGSGEAAFLPTGHCRSGYDLASSTYVTASAYDSSNTSLVTNRAINCVPGDNRVVPVPSLSIVVDPWVVQGPPTVEKAIKECKSRDNMRLPTKIELGKLLTLLDTTYGDEDDGEPDITYFNNDIEGKIDSLIYNHEIPRYYSPTNGFYSESTGKRQPYLLCVKAINLDQLP